MGKKAQPAKKIVPATKRRRLYETSPQEEKTVVMPDEKVVPAPRKPSETAPQSEMAWSIVKKYAMVSAGTALVPIPYVDMLANTATQLLMVRSLCNLYKLEFTAQRAKAIIGSVVGGVNIGLASNFFLKFVPFIGTVGSFATTASYSSAFTFAIGMVFIRHFEAGGTLSNMDADRVKQHLEQEMKKA